MIFSCLRAAFSVTVEKKFSPNPQAVPAPPGTHYRTRQASTTPSSSRRDVLLSSPLAMSALLPNMDSLMEQREPEKGNCPTCIGAVDGTLGSCSATPSCLSSYDDRPDHFIAPWEYDTRNRDTAMERLIQAVQQAGATQVEREGSSYLYAVFPPGEGFWALGQGTDDVEFLFADDNDTRVELRSASRLPAVPDGGRQRRRLEAIRAALVWEQVPVMRNRQRVFVVIESPWDTFGPTPPADQQLGGMRFEDSIND